MAGSLSGWRAGGLPGLARAPRRDRDTRRQPAELVALVEGLALRRPRSSTAHIHRQAVGVAGERGWRAPSYGTVHLSSWRWIRDWWRSRTTVRRATATALSWSFAARPRQPTRSGRPTTPSRLLYLSGDLEAAGEAFRASIATGHLAYAPVASYHLARLHEELRNTETAMEACRQASESLDPKQASAAIYKLGCLLKGKGETAAARTAFERAAAMTNTWYGHLADNALRTLA